MNIKTLYDLFLEELFEIYNAEKQLLIAFPSIITASTDLKLSINFKAHLRETTEQVKRLDNIFLLLNKKPEKIICPSMKGMIDEAHHLIDCISNKHILDAALIMIMLKIEYYEISTYRALCSLADCLGYSEVVQILHLNLNEEKQEKDILCILSEGSINETALKKAA